MGLVGVHLLMLMFTTLKALLKDAVDSIYTLKVVARMADADTVIVWAELSITIWELE